MLHPTKIASNWDARIWVDGVGEAERQLEITPAIAGWDALSFRTYTFRTGQVIAGESGGDEMCLVLLSGAITMEAAGQTWICAGRTSVFTGPPYAIYLPPGHTYRMSVQRDADCAYGRAPATGAFPPRLLTPADMTPAPADPASNHRVTRILGPGVAERLTCSEATLSPGTWDLASSSHPHALGRTPKTAIEAVSYYRISPEDGYALQRLSATSDPDVVVIARHGDAVMIRQPDVPLVTAPGSEVYRLSFTTASGSD